MRQYFNGVFLLAVLPLSPASAQSCNTGTRSVLLNFDPSGSMNTKLPNGETRVAVAVVDSAPTVVSINARVETKRGTAAPRPTTPAKWFASFREK